MKQSELKQLIREEIFKVLNEGKNVEIKFNLTAYPRKHHDSKQPNKINIPAGATIEVIEHPFTNQPNDSLIKYKDQEWVVVKSSLDSVM